MKSENSSVYQVAVQQNESEGTRAVVPSQWPYAVAHGPADARTVVLAEMEQVSLDESARLLTALLPSIRPGQRLRLVGSLAFIGQMAANALAEGLLTQEIEVSIQDGPANVWCACCSRTSAQASPDPTHLCPHCHTPLSVRRPQFSPRLGAFLGVAQLPEAGSPTHMAPTR